MTTLQHTYGASCLRRPLEERKGSRDSEEPPRIKAQFFYNSQLAIDDPLSPIPSAPGSSTSSALKVSPKPFSAYDNAALEEAWVGVREQLKRREDLCDFHKSLRRHDEGFETFALDYSEQASERISSSSNDREEKSQATEGNILSSQWPHAESGAQGSEGIPDCPICEGDKSRVETLEKVSGQTLGRFKSNSIAMPLRLISKDHTPKAEVSRREEDSFSQSLPLEGVLIPSDTNIDTAVDVGSVRGNRRSTLYTPSSQLRPRPRSAIIGKLDEHEGSEWGCSPAPKESKHSDTSETVVQSSSRSPRSARPDSQRRASSGKVELHQPFKDRRLWKEDQDTSEAQKFATAIVPVGLSRLHSVQFPKLKMKPIYWNLVHDISDVVRATWFYKDTLLPVESDLANLLEVGYLDIRPWTRTYKDEVNSCLTVGPAAELRVLHKLLGEEEQEIDGNGQILLQRRLLADNLADGSFASGVSPSLKILSKAGVIYANKKEAQILLPKQFPSASRNRGSLAAIVKGQAVGIRVIRGFDSKLWDALHPQKTNLSVRKAQKAAMTTQSGTTSSRNPRSVCRACVIENERPQVTDLILVIHGIGQKLSERVESFHFTHAINDFRRQVAVEQESEVVQNVLRRNLGEIMVLPVNWRSTVEFEGEKTIKTPTGGQTSSGRFTLQDIMVESIPSIRKLMSDVIIDIPYYLSQHKTRMLEAVVKEANRVFSLWIENNPGFHKTGRVHLIAHSLGSCIALDILSQQATSLPKEIDIPAANQSTTFAFDTKNLFLCGSPAGLFLLLNRAQLLPRKDRGKPHCGPEDKDNEVTGSAGDFGCLAVDNIYNVIHVNDPVACKLNACADVEYASSLQAARVPSTATTWYQSIASMFRGKPQTPAQIPNNIDQVPSRPTTARLPSTVEMETHDFAREDLAEKKMFLLNDNGQIDYILGSGGGPLEFQYLNMLSAHSSYWILQDFVRFIVLEVGRKPGRNNTLLNMRAVKKTKVLKLNK